MDSSFSYFHAAPQPYQFFPPTSAASSTPHGDDFRNSLGPEQYDAAFAAFQQSFHYDPTSFLAQPHDVAPQSPSKPLRTDSVISIPEININNIYPPSNDGTPDEQTGRRSSSEDKEDRDALTPAQSRRKAQNRAAQRAFRERKEKHVKELEASLRALQHQSASLNGENERLKRELAKIATENEILKATSGSNSGANSYMEDMDDVAIGPLRYSPTDYKSNPAESLFGELKIAGVPKSGVFSTSRRIFVDEETGEPLLAAGATWDYIQSHELFRKGLVDVGDVCERLKKMARCDGQGPVFQEGDVRKAIAESAVAGGRDELI